MTKIYSWNVNGIRAAVNKGFFCFVDEHKPDILCIQETKAQPEQIELEMHNKGYQYEFFNSAEKKGYSGVALYSKIKPIDVTFEIEGLDLSSSEGRIITAEFEDFYVVTSYTPNSKRDLSRVDYRYEEWDIKFLAYCKKLEKKKSVIFCGDLNAAHTELDVKNDKANQTTQTKPGNPGFTDKEREGITNIKAAGFVDTFRHFHPQKEKFSWWSYMGNARAKNVGWRIDYVFVSNQLKDQLKGADIHDDVMGSDHCPVSVTLK